MLPQRLVFCWTPQIRLKYGDIHYIEQYAVLGAAKKKNKSHIHFSKSTYELIALRLKVHNAMEMCLIHVQFSS